MAITSIMLLKNSVKYLVLHFFLQEELSYQVSHETQAKVPRGLQSYMHLQSVKLLTRHVAVVKHACQTWFF